MPTQYQVILITAPDKAAASKITEGLLNKRLAACVSMVPSVESSYWWENKIEKAEEFLLIVKTRITLTPDIIQFIRENHPHKIPEVISFEIACGNDKYLDWLGANSTFTRSLPKDDKEKSQL